MAAASVGFFATGVCVAGFAGAEDCAEVDCAGVVGAAKINAMAKIVGSVERVHDYLRRIANTKRSITYQRACEAVLKVDGNASHFDLRKFTQLCTDVSLQTTARVPYNFIWKT